MHWPQRVNFSPRDPRILKWTKVRTPGSGAKNKTLCDAGISLDTQDISCYCSVLTIFSLVEFDTCIVAASVLQADASSSYFVPGIVGRDFDMVN